MSTQIPDEPKTPDDNGFMTRQNMYRFVFAVFIILAAFGVKDGINANRSSFRGVPPEYKGFSAQTGVPQPPRPQKPRECLAVLEQAGTHNDVGTTITGLVKNNCGRDFSYVQITFRLIDETSALVGTAMANQANLRVGESWRFKAHGFTSAHRFELDDLTGH